MLFSELALSTQVVIQFTASNYVQLLLKNFTLSLLHHSLAYGESYLIGDCSLWLEAIWRVSEENVYALKKAERRMVKTCWNNMQSKPKFVRERCRWLCTDKQAPWPPLVAIVHWLGRWECMRARTEEVNNFPLPLSTLSRRDIVDKSMLTSSIRMISACQDRI